MKHYVACDIKKLRELFHNQSCHQRDNVILLRKIFIYILKIYLEKFIYILEISLPRNPDTLHKHDNVNFP